MLGWIQTFLKPRIFLAGFVLIGSWTILESVLKKPDAVLMSWFMGFMWTEGRFAAKKKRVSKRFGFNEQIHWFHVNDVNRGSFREKKKSGFKYILIRVEVPYTHQYYECVLNMKAKMVCYVYLFLDLVRKVNF